MRSAKKVSLGFYPTPLHKLDNLSKKLGYELYIKRDDLTGLAFGGNKTRKLEYLIADALEHHAKAVVTEGAAQSNHVRQTAAAARKYGLDAHLLLWKPEPEHYNGNLLVDMLLGAKVHWINPQNAYKDRLKVLGALRDCYGMDPYYIPLGGSNEIGLLGYIDAIDELKTQMEYLQVKFDYIVFASSSGGTQAGMILGKKLYNVRAELIGIEIGKMYQNKTLEQHIQIISNYAVEHFNLPARVEEDDITVIHEYSKPGYSVITDLERNAIYTLGQEEGIILDPVYTGRAFGGLLDLIEKGYFPKHSKILFWHTGGQPSNFAFAQQIFQKQEISKDNKYLEKEIL